MWKPNTKYRVKVSYRMNTGYEFITAQNTHIVIITKEGEGWKKGEVVALSSFNHLAFEEVKPKKNHLPDWL